MAHGTNFPVPNLPEPGEPRETQGIVLLAVGVACGDPPDQAKLDAEILEASNRLLLAGFSTVTYGSEEWRTIVADAAKRIEDE